MEDDKDEGSTCVGRMIWRMAYPLRLLFSWTCANCEEGSDWRVGRPSELVLDSVLETVDKTFREVWQHVTGLETWLAGLINWPKLSSKAIVNQ